MHFIHNEQPEKVKVLPDALHATTTVPVYPVAHFMWQSLNIDPSAQPAVEFTSYPAGSVVGLVHMAGEGAIREGRIHMKKAGAGKTKSSYFVPPRLIHFLFRLDENKAKTNREKKKHQKRHKEYSIQADPICRSM